MSGESWRRVAGRRRGAAGWCAVGAAGVMVAFGGGSAGASGVAGGGGVVAVGAGEFGAVVYYFDEARTIEVWGGRLAVYVGSEGAGGEAVGRGVVEGLVEAGGVDGARVSRHALAGWWEIEFGGGVEGDGAVDAGAHGRGVAALMAGAAALEGVGGGDGAVFMTEVFRDGAGGALIPTEWALVRFAEGVDAAAARGLVEAGGFEFVGGGWLGGMEGAYRLRAGEALRRAGGRAVLDAIAGLAARDETVFAEPDLIFEGRGGSSAPNDPAFTQSWGLDNRGQSGCCVGIDLRALGAWKTTTGDASIVAVVIDTGVQPDHPDLSLLPGFDATGQNGGGAPVNDCDNHGTPVAGALGALIDNGVGSSGMAPGVSLVSARAFVSTLPTPCSGAWGSTPSWTVACLEFASDIGARVTNNSNFYNFPSSAITSMYEMTRDAGMVHFAAAGNSGNASITYPASLATVNAVSAITPSGSLASFSSFGSGLAFAGPGVGIYTTDRTGFDGFAPGSFVQINGTSFASPLVAGVAALMLSVDPGLMPDEIEGIMRSTALDLGTPGFDSSFGWGLPRADAAVGVVAVPACPGDVDGDGDVDSDDLGIVLGAFGCSGGGCAGDVDGDGDVDSDDLGVLLGGFGCGG
ncbi:MAG: S8 family peptidase [Phycisphaerales bacterium]